MNTPDVDPPAAPIHTAERPYSAHRVDPIEYGWSLCNPGIPLPAVLARSVFRHPITGHLNGEVNAAKAATHSGILRRRMPRQHGVS